MKKIAVFVAIILISNSINLHSELETKSISIFKNGKSFVIKEGKVDTKDKIFVLDKVPNALMGTFWFSGLNSNVTQVISKREEISEPLERKAINYLDLLYANKGMEVTITTNDDKIYTGVVEEITLPEEINSMLKLKYDELKEVYEDLERNTFLISDFNIGTIAINPISFKMNNKWLTLSPYNVKTIEFPEKPNNLVKSTLKLKKPIIKVHFEKDGSQDLNMMYLQNGIVWNPTYQLTLISETEANLKLQAEVINDVEDLKNIDINFVIGTPNFAYANSPATLNNWIKQARDYYSDGGYNYSNAIVPNQMMMMKSAEYVMEDAAFSSPINAGNEAEANEDFYFYNVKNVDLEKNARAHYPLFDTKVKIKHLYECNLPNTLTPNSYYNIQTSYSFDTKYSEVFHTIEVQNNSKTPFTTAPVMIINAGKNGETEKPLAQDLMKYTGVGLNSSIKLAQSSDIRVEEKEKMTNLDNENKTINGEKYRLATIESEITIINSKNEDINFALNKTILGELQKCSEEFEKTSRIINQNVNPTENISLKIPLKARETKKINLTYQIYVR